MTVQPQVQSATLILRVCGSCLSEIAALRREVKELLDRIPADLGNAKALSGNSTACSDSVSPEANLRELCAVEDALLREHLVTAFQAGELSVELHDLVDRICAQSNSITLPMVREAVLDEFGRGTMQAVMLREGGVESDPRLVQAAIACELEASSTSTTVVIAMSPTFRQPARPLLEGLLRRCELDRLAVPMDLLCEAMTALITPNSAREDRVFDEVALLKLLNDKASNTENETLDATPNGRVFVRGPSTSLPPFDGDADKASADLENLSSRADASTLKEIFHMVEEHFDIFQAVSNLRSSRKPAHDNVPSNLLLGLLGTLQVRGAMRALGLPQALCECSGGDLVWAAEFAGLRRTDSAVRAPQDVSTMDSTILHPHGAGRVEKLEMTVLPMDSGACEYSNPGDGCELADSTDCESNGLPTISLGSATQTPFCSESTGGGKDMSRFSSNATECDTMAGGDDSPSKNCIGGDVDSTSFSAAQATTDPAAVDDVIATGNDEELAKNRAKTLFVQCFKDDLLESRHLLLSQVNNLYKMRNAGEVLPYKAAGYDKLHDFVVKIPGLGLQGSGNRMQVRIIERAKFEELCECTEDDPSVPVFQKPLPVPESFQQKVIEVFRKMGTREIAAKSFRDVWNRVFPEQKLQVKEFGYRDVRGLLANVSAIDRVGGKYYSKYILKDEVPLTEAAAMPLTVPTTGTICDVSAAGQSSGQHQESFDLPQHVPTRITSATAPASTQDPIDWCLGLGFSAPETGNAAIKDIQQNGLGLNRPADCNLSAFGARLPGAAHHVDGFGSALLSQPAQRPPGIWSDSAPEPPRQHWPETAASAKQQIPPQSQSFARIPPPAVFSSPERSGEVRMSLSGDLTTEVGRTLQDLALQDLISSRRPSGPSNVQSPSPLAITTGGRAFDPTSDPELSAGVPSTLPLGLAVSPPRNLVVGVSGGASTLNDTNVEFPAGARPRSGSRDYSDLSSSVTTGLTLLGARPAPVPLDLVDGSDDAKKFKCAELAPLAPLEDPQSTAVGGPGDFRKMRRARKTPKASMQFVSAPGAFSSEDFDASKHQGKFDMGALYQAELRNDRIALILDIYNGRVLFTNVLCDRLFENMVPLPHREAVELIFEADRIQFSASVMYLNIGKFNQMEPQRLRINSARGVLWAFLSGEQLADTWWRVDITLEEDGGNEGVGETELVSDFPRFVPNELSL